MPLYKSAYPERKKAHSLVKLYEHFIGEKFEAHDARYDVKALKRLIIYNRFATNELCEHSFTLASFKGYCKHQRESKQREHTFRPLVRSKALSDSMAERIAKSGLHLRHLQAVHQRADDPLEGLRDLLSERFDGKIRVTNDRQVISKLNLWLENHSSL